MIPGIRIYLPIDRFRSVVVLNRRVTGNERVVGQIDVRKPDLMPRISWPRGRTVAIAVGDVARRRLQVVIYIW